MSTQAKNYGIITSADDLSRAVQALGEGPVGFDVETGYTGEDREKGALRPHEGAFITGFSISGDPSWARWIPLRHDEGPNMDPAVAWEIMEPVLCHGERVVAHNCFTADTPILTRDGIRTLSALQDQAVEVVTEHGFEWAKVRSYGVSDEVREIEVAPAWRSRSSIRHTFQATGDHRWELRDGRVVTTDDLRPRDVIRAQASAVDLDTYSPAFVHGLVFADGARCSRQEGKTSGIRFQIRLCGDKARFADRFTKVNYYPSYGGDPTAYVTSDIDLKALPVHADAQYIAEFIAGWESLDGTTRSGGDVRTVNTVDGEAAAWLAEHAALAGWIVTGRSAHDASSSSYGSTRVHYVQMSRADDLGWSVKSVRDVPGAHEVFCAEVPGTERFTLGGGVYTSNCKFEIRAMRTEGIELSVRSDTMLEAFLTARYPTDDLGLKSLVKRCFNHDQAEIKTLFIDPETGKEPTAKFLKRMRFNTLPSDRPDVVAYACEDAAWCLALHEMHYDEARSIAGGGLFKVDHEIMWILADMEDWGVQADWTAIAASLQKGEQFAEAFEESVRTGLNALVRAKHGPEASIDAFKAKKDVRFNLGSTHQLQKLFFTEAEGLELPPVKYTDSGAPSTDAIALNALAQDHEAVRDLLKLREVWNLVKRHEKWLTDYTEASDGRVHASYGQTVISSARFNASDPAIQQIPKKWGWTFVSDEGEQSWTGNYRSFIVAAEGHYYLGFDYSQIELRFMAGEAREKALLDAFNNGEDVHSLTAAMMLNKPLEEVDRDTERPVGKTMNFALLYQMGVKSLADRLALSKDRAQELYDEYFRNMPAIANWQARVTREGKERGGTINRFGRKATVWELATTDLYHKGERMLVNIPIQGGAADYMRIAMVRAKKALQKAGLYGDGVKLVINMHDALTFEVRNDVHPKAVLDLLVPAVEFPMEGMPRMLSEWDIGPSWGAATEFDYEDVEFEFSESLGRWIVSGSPQPVEKDVDDDDLDALDDEIEVPESFDAESETPATPEIAEVRVSGEPRLVIEMVQMPFEVQWRRFLTMLDERPGEVPVMVNTPEGQEMLMLTTSMTPADAARVSVCLPGSRMYYPEGSVPLEEMGGLTL